MIAGLPDHWPPQRERLPDREPITAAVVVLGACGWTAIVVAAVLALVAA